MKILVTGSDGYIGSVLCPLLMREGHEVTGFDTGFYRKGLLYNTMDSLPRTITADLRLVRLDSYCRRPNEIVPEPILQNQDAIVHLGELSNDPLGQNNPKVTYSINHHGSVVLAANAMAAGVKRFIYASSCSVYGAANGEAPMTERSPVNPQTAYAECKVNVEREVGNLATTYFSPVFLRNDTAFGASPRMRFDIVLNNLAGHAWTTKQIKMDSDGTPFRPLVHVKDICQAVSLCLKAPQDSIHNQIFNVGSDRQNYSIREIAEVIADVFPDCITTFGDSSGDNRSYRVSFAKIRQHLPDFVCQYTARDGAEELRAVFHRINLSKDDFAASPFTRLKQLKWLLETGQLNRDLFWSL